MYAKAIISGFSISITALLIILFLEISLKKIVVFIKDKKDPWRKYV